MVHQTHGRYGRSQTLARRYSEDDIPVSRKREGSGRQRTRDSRAWPGWARVTVSLLLVFHLVAVISGGLAVPPSSVLERSIADLFTPYYGLADLGYAYRFYVEPPPTPVVTATLRFGDGPTGGDGAAAWPGPARPPDAAPASARAGECSFHGRAGGQATYRATGRGVCWLELTRGISA